MARYPWRDAGAGARRRTVPQGPRKPSRRPSGRQLFQETPCDRHVVSRQSARLSARGSRLPGRYPIDSKTIILTCWRKAARRKDTAASIIYLCAPTRTQYRPLSIDLRSWRSTASRSQTSRCRAATRYSSRSGRILHLRRGQQRTSIAGARHDIVQAIIRAAE